MLEEKTVIEQVTTHRSDTFRQKYRQLSREEQERIERIKDLAELIEKEIIPPSARRNGYDISRHQGLAMTNLEQAVMWAVKGITR